MIAITIIKGSALVLDNIGTTLKFFYNQFLLQTESESGWHSKTEFVS